MPDKNKDAIKAYKDSIRQAESGGSRTAKAPTSSATGLYQFTESTWKEMEKKLGKKLDIFSEKDQELAMNKLTEINVNALQKNNIPVTPSNLYMTHFLGVTGGPKFLKNLEKNPNELASKYVSAGAVKANTNLFYNEDKPVTAAELYNKLSSKVGGETIAPTQNIQPQVIPLQENVNTVIESTSTERPRLNRDLKPSNQTTPKQVVDNTDLTLSPVEGIRNTLGLAGDLDFLPKDINLAFTEEEQLNQDLNNPDELINIAKYGGKQKVNYYKNGGQALTNTEPHNKVLETFDVGGSHEDNKYGGIPQGIGDNGKLNTVEEGETKFDNYVFSDTLVVNDNDVESLFLPKEIANKTFADASKYINSILEDNPNDMIIKKTVQKQLDSLTLGNEKARLAKEQLDINLGKDNLFTELSEDSNQMFLGGVAGQNSAMNMDYLKMAGSLGNNLGNNTNLSNTPMSAEEQSNASAWETGKDAVASAFPIAGLFRGAEKLGKGLGQSIGGDTGGDFASGFLDPIGTVMNEDTNFGEKTLSVLDPVVSGFILADKNKKRREEANRIQHIQQSGTYQNDFATGGDLKDNYNVPTKEELNNYIPFSLEDPYLYDNLNFRINTELSPTGELNLGSYTPKLNNYIPDTGYTSNFNTNDFPTTSNINSLTNDTKSTYNPKGKNYLQYAPVLGDFLNYGEARKDKPEVENLNRLDNRFTPDYVDEAYLQNIANNDFNNTVDALTSATNGSQGALRNNILGAGLNRNRALSDAYFRGDEINRTQNLTGQQFNLGIDQFNVGQDNMERDINARNRAAVEDRRRASRDTLFRDIGAIGREQTYDNRLYNLTGGYDSMGGYNPDRMTFLEQLGLAGSNKKESGGLLSSAYSSTLGKSKQIEEDFNKRYK